MTLTAAQDPDERKKIRSRLLEVKKVNSEKREKERQEREQRIEDSVHERLKAKGEECMQRMQKFDETAKSHGTRAESAIDQSKERALQEKKAYIEKARQEELARIDEAAKSHISANISNTKIHAESLAKEWQLQDKESQDKHLKELSKFTSKPEQLGLAKGKKRLVALYQWLNEKFQPELIQYLQWTCSNGKQLSTLNIHDFTCTVAEDKTLTSTKLKELFSTVKPLVRENMEPITTIETTLKLRTTTTTTLLTNIITDLNVWIKDDNSAIIEWNTSSIIPNHLLVLRLIVIENGYLLPSLNLNISQKYFLLEKLKSQTQYTICLTILNTQKYCRDLITGSTTTPIPLSKAISISKTSTTTLTSTDIQYLILGTVLGAISVLLILIVFIIILVRKQRRKKHESSKTTSIESYYNAGGSDISALSSEQQPTLKCLPPPPLLTPFYYFPPSECPHNCCTSLSMNGGVGGDFERSGTNSTDLSNINPSTYHIYHEIPFSDTCTSALRRPNIFDNTHLIEQQQLRHTTPIII
ncbi:unnamed protein product [Didymodactylos carnosus]|uniref:Uncharacterized protein n=1 Tax=Didymodactylos carnosus TaxID=1234261 RepID=A0A8S2EBW7_9BILA|nr:unnamed protein product [Didymodactylos carnosus]CAF3995917.1 unnamed protein product [Didymodactylos carnosus]